MYSLELCEWKCTKTSFLIQQVKTSSVEISRERFVAACTPSRTHTGERGRVCAIGSSKMFVYERGWGWQCLLDERKFWARENVSVLQQVFIEWSPARLAYTRSRVEKSFLISSLESLLVGCGCLFMVRAQSSPIYCGSTSDVCSLALFGEEEKKSF